MGRDPEKSGLTAMSAGTKIRFTDPVILVGGGDVDMAQLGFTAARGFPVVAVDSGADALSEYGIEPKAIIGDMDSISSASGWPPGTEFLEISEQNSTDFEKALYTVAAPVYLAFGFLGQRFDHSLAALHCLAKYRASKSVVLVDLVDLMFIPTVPLNIELDPGSRFSIYPIAPVSFLESAGLRYPLDGLTLEAGVTIGTSNTVTETRVSVTPKNAESGDYMVVIANTNLPRVIEWYNRRNPPAG